MGNYNHVMSRPVESIKLLKTIAQCHCKCHKCVLRLC